MNTTQKQKPILFTQIKEPQTPKLDLLHLVLGNKKIDVADVLIDTGFDSDIALPVVYAIKSGIEQVDFFNVEYANGFTDSLGFTKGKVKIMEFEFEVEIVWLDDSDEALIGSGFLSKYTKYLNIDYQNSTLKIQL